MMSKDKKKNEKEKGYSAGWVCPLCGSVYAIWVSKCSNCVPKTVATDTSNEWVYEIAELETNYARLLAVARAAKDTLCDCDICEDGRGELRAALAAVEDLLSEEV